MLKPWIIIVQWNSRYFKLFYFKFFPGVTIYVGPINCFWFNNTSHKPTIFNNLLEGTDLIDNISLMGELKDWSLLTIQFIIHIRPNGLTRELTVLVELRYDKGNPAQHMGSASRAPCSAPTVYCHLSRVLKITPTKTADATFTFHPRN